MVTSTLTCGIATAYNVQGNQMQIQTPTITRSFH